MTKLPDIDIIDNDMLQLYAKLGQAKREGWPQLLVPIGSRSISDEWLRDNMQRTYLCFGYYWYFECEEDATIFKLRWL